MRRPKARQAYEEERAAIEIAVPIDTQNEAVILASAIADKEARRRLVKKLRPDHFRYEVHARAWAAITEIDRGGLECTPEALRAIAGIDDERDRYVEGLPAPALGANLALHEDRVLWNHARHTASTGPLSLLLEALSDTQSSPEKVRSLARRVAVAFDGFEDRRYLCDPNQLLRDARDLVQKAREGIAIYPYGIPGLDDYEAGYAEGMAAKTRARLIPGASPGKVTLVTALSGGGKSTFVKLLILGLVRQGRKVLFGCWEEEPEEAITDIAAMSLWQSRVAITTGQITDDEHRQLDERKAVIAEYVRFIRNPFQRVVAERTSNERNLDLLHGYVADSGCDVVVLDLWERLLVDDDPSAEKAALFRTQAMAQETRVHMIATAQQRLADVERRRDPKPTREGIKGSKAYVEIADTILAPHRPSMFKPSMQDDRFQVCILKQRKVGAWPMIVDFEADIDRGILRGGTTLPYEIAVDRQEDSLGLPPMAENARRRKGRRE